MTAYRSGVATIIAEATDPTDGDTDRYGSAACAVPCSPRSQDPALKATITIYNEGLNTTKWEVTALLLPVRRT